jgi:predicted MFS family arabinose efflux permease
MLHRKPMSLAATRTAGPTSWLVFAAAAILLLTMGIRQSLGLFVLPIVNTAGISIAAVSLALALGQLVWGAAQPVLGAVADAYGADRVMIAGALLLAAGAALTPLYTSALGLIGCLGVLVATGAAAGSFAILIGVTARHLQPQQRSLAAGIINAGGSLGQLLLAPSAQWLISRSGWRVAMLAMALAALLTIPIARLFRAHGNQSAAAAPASSVEALARQLRRALRDRSYWLLQAGFFTCGFHVAFLVTHLPGDLQMCGLAPRVAANAIGLIGLCNVGGSLAAGWLGQRFRMKNLLALIYAARALIVAGYVLMPKTALNVYLASGAFGVTWLATVPPTAGLVGKLFGTRYLATLFGLTLLAHQVGGFLGAWLGGVAMAQLGSYAWVWYADFGLALLAALLNLPIRERAPALAGVAAA